MKTLNLAAIAIAILMNSSGFGQEQTEGGFTGGLSEAATVHPAPKPVRNDVAQLADPIVTIRYFKIQKGAFPEFLKASREGVWPYFEKIGSRVVGMWQVIHPAIDGETVGTDSPGYDEVILMTQYASVDHWRASRDAIDHGGNGPDWDACANALEYRRSVTIETEVQFLKGETWENPPIFMPGLKEVYEKAE